MGKKEGRSICITIVELALTAVRYYENCGSGGQVRVCVCAARAARAAVGGNAFVLSVLV